MTLINEEPTSRKTTRVLLAKMSAGALMAFCELLERATWSKAMNLSMSIWASNGQNRNRRPRRSRQFAKIS